jgi:hypothetical protein
VTARADAAARLSDASTYLEAFGHIVVAWLWLEQHLATGDAADDFHQGKRLAARWFFARELPKTRFQLALVRSADDTTVCLDEAWL